MDGDAPSSPCLNLSDDRASPSSFVLSETGALAVCEKRPCAPLRTRESLLLGILLPDFRLCRKGRAFIVMPNIQTYNVIPNLPLQLEPLREMVFNLWWTCEPSA